MQNLMAQAQRVQKELEKANQEIENSVFVGKSGAVNATLSGKMVLTKVEITDDSILSDKDMLQDMVVVAVNDALSQVGKMKEEKLGKYAGGLGGLF